MQANKQRRRSPHLIILLGGHHAGGHIVHKVVQQLTGSVHSAHKRGAMAGKQSVTERARVRKKKVRVKQSNREYESSSQMALHICRSENCDRKGRRKGNNNTGQPQIRERGHYVAAAGNGGESSRAGGVDGTAVAQMNQLTLVNWYVV